VNVSSPLQEERMNHEATKGFTKKEKQEGHLAGQSAYNLVVFLSSS
jgi:hypothetical protein